MVQVTVLGRQRTIGSHHTPNKPRVAVLAYHTSPVAEIGGSEVGGMNVYVRELCQALGSRGFSLDVFTRRAADAAPEIQPFGPNVRIVNIDSGPAIHLERDHLSEHIASFRDGVEGFALRESLTYSLIASHYWMSGVAGIELARSWHVPHIAMFHTLGEVKNQARADELESPERIAAEQGVVAAADAIVVATAHEKLLLESLYSADPGRIVEVPCGVDLELFAPMDREAARAAMGFKLDQRVVLFVGRIEPLKGIDLLLDALAVLGDPRVKVVVAGGDAGALAEIDRLRAKARSLGIYELVSFIGAVEHAELPRYFSAADLTAVPSFYESFGLVAVESLACGTPVVASDVGGLASIVIDGVNGYRVAGRAPEDFAAGMRAVLRRRDELVEACRPSVERFWWPRVADEIAMVYQDLLLAHERSAHRVESLAGAD